MSPEQKFTLQPASGFCQLCKFAKFTLPAGLLLAKIL
jgi:hypothetical protein